MAEVTKINVQLIAKASDDLLKIINRTSMSRDDIINRAISLYEFIESEMNSGGKLKIERDGTNYDVELL